MYNKEASMCGRYTLFTEEEYQDIRNIIREVQDKLGGGQLKTGEIYPTNLAPVLCGVRAEPETAVWGFPNFRGKGAIINARSETAAEKRLFRKPLAESRCVVPTTGFYEWDAEKKKHLFRLSGAGELYLGGLLGEFAGERRYVILTAAANASMEGIHHRMPVVIPKNRIGEWLASADAAAGLLQAAPPPLVNRIT